MDQVFHFFGGNESKGEERIFLWGRATEEAGGHEVVLDSVHIQVAQVALSNQGKALCAYISETTPLCKLKRNLEGEGESIRCQIIKQYCCRRTGRRKR